MASRKNIPKNLDPPPPASADNGEIGSGKTKMTVMPILLGDIITTGQLVREAQEDDHVIELATSISRHGLLEPIVVENLGKRGYQLVAGFHRLAACARLGWKVIPANIRVHEEDVPVKSLALVENICRKDLSLSEQVEAIAHLHDNEKLSPSEICLLVGKSRAWVDRRLALPYLYPEITAALFEGLITLSIAEVISNVEEDGKRREILNQAVYTRRTLSQVKDLIALHDAAPTIQTAVDKGLETAAHQQETRREGRACDACGLHQPIQSLANIWVCSAGCAKEGNDQTPG